VIFLVVNTFGTTFTATDSSRNIKCHTNYGHQSRKWRHAFSTYNPAVYFTSFERIVPSAERARKNARNEENARQDYMSNHSMGFLFVYDKP
jgi:hypothetical protein